MMKNEQKKEDERKIKIMEVQEIHNYSNTAVLPLTYSSETCTVTKKLG
jgi:hypothetical protein